MHCGPRIVPNWGHREIFLNFMGSTCFFTIFLLEIKISLSKIQFISTKSSWSSGNGTPAGVPALGSNRLGHLPAYNRACPDGRPLGD